MLRGKRRIDAVQMSVDNARMHVNAVNDELLVILREGPPKVTLEEAGRMVERLVMAEDAIREARLVLEYAGGG